MKLFVIALLVAACYADKLDNTYLPPSNAQSAGGNGNFLSAPAGTSGFGSAFGTKAGSGHSVGLGGASAHSSGFGGHSTGFGGISVFGQKSGFGGQSGFIKPSVFAGQSGFGVQSGFGGQAGFGGQSSGFVGKSSGFQQSSGLGSHTGYGGHPSGASSTFGQKSSVFEAGSTFGSKSGGFGSSNLGGAYTFGKAIAGVAPVAPSSAYGAPGGQGSYRLNAGPQVPIVRFVNDNFGDGNYQYAYETGNGIKAQEAGHLKNDANEVQGSFGYTGDDGAQYSVSYIADENGYQPQGAHLPTPPPIPEAILKSIQQNAAAEAAGVGYGQYDAGSTGQYRKNIAGSGLGAASLAGAGHGGASQYYQGSSGFKSGGFTGAGNFGHSGNLGVSSGFKSGSFGSSGSFGNAAASRQYLAPRQQSFNTNTGYNY